MGTHRTDYHEDEWTDYNEDIEVSQYHREYAIDRGYGVEYVTFKARRKSRPAVSGYGKTLAEAVEDLLKKD